VGAHATDDGGGDLDSTIAAFYDRSVREVYRYFHRATAGDRRLTEDLTQETFMACVRAAQQGQADATTMPWLMGVARHKLIDHHRRRTREDRKLSLAWSAEPVLESMLDADVTDAEALDALHSLSPLHRLVLMLRYVDDLAVADVAAAIGRSLRATDIAPRAGSQLARRATGRRVPCLTSASVTCSISSMLSRPRSSRPPSATGCSPSWRHPAVHARAIKQ
jgi:RNA polymerase sigma-70 factor (ECF subfamily)